MRTEARWVSILLLLLVVAIPARAGKIKLATLAPDGSPWHKHLEKMGNEWQQATDGRVRLVIYPGGVAGSDSDMVRKIRIRQIQATKKVSPPSTRLSLTPLVKSMRSWTVRP